MIPCIRLMQLAFIAFLFLSFLTLASSPVASPVSTIPFLPNVSKCKSLNHPTTYPINPQQHVPISGNKMYALPLLSNGPANQMSQLKNALMLGTLLGRCGAHGHARGCEHHVYNVGD